MSDVRKLDLCGEVSAQLLLNMSEEQKGGSEVSRQKFLELIALWPFMAGAYAGTKIGEAIVMNAGSERVMHVPQASHDVGNKYEPMPALRVGPATIRQIGVTHVSPVLYREAPDMESRIRKAPAVFSESIGADGATAFGEHASAAEIRAYFDAHPRLAENVDSYFFQGVTALAGKEGKDIIVTDPQSKGVFMLDMLYAIGIPVGLLTETLAIATRELLKDDPDATIPVSDIIQKVEHAFKISRRTLFAGALGLAAWQWATYYKLAIQQDLRVSASDIEYWIGKSKHMDTTMPSGLSAKERMLWVGRNSFVWRDARMALGTQASVETWKDIPWEDGEAPYFHGRNHTPMARSILQPSFQKGKIAMHPDFEFLGQGTLARRYRYDPQKREYTRIASIDSTTARSSRR